TKLSSEEFFRLGLLIASYREYFVVSRTFFRFQVRSLLTELLVIKFKKDYFALIEDNSSANHLIVKTIKQLKERLSHYQKVNTKTKSRQKTEQKKEPVIIRMDKLRRTQGCFNCAEENHLSRDCPEKSE
ncbi:hypothetical protein PV325_013520, partial [Microctonus aethiopoides]